MKSLLFLFALIATLHSETRSPVALSDLRCENTKSPAIVQTATPHLSWKLSGSNRGVYQKSFHILASSTEEKLAASEGDLWDSGETPSNRSQHVPYNGMPVKDGKTIYWKVRIKDQNDQTTEWSPAAQFAINLGAPTEANISLYLKDAPRISAFECSDATLTNLYAKAAETLPLASSSLRDIHLTLRSASYHQELFPRAKEWLAALNTAVDKEGRYPAKLPTDGSFASTQSDAGILAAHTLYATSGDLTLLKNHWKTLNGYIYARKKHDPTFAGRAFGKLPNDTLPKGDAMPESTIHLASHALSLRIMKELCRAAAETPFEQPSLQNALTNLQKSFKKIHFNKKNEFKYTSITGQLITLRYGLLTRPEDKKAVSTQFLKLLDKKKNAAPFSHGPLASSAILPVLTWTDNLELAVSLTQSQASEDLSPVAVASISEWLISMVAGIGNTGTGFQSLILSPYIPKKEILNYAKAHLDTAYGRISSHWHYEDDGLAYDVSLPSNTQAVVKIPATEKQLLTEGGKKVEKGNGILKVIRHPDHAEITLLSGSYQFQVAN